MNPNEQTPCLALLCDAMGVILQVIDDQIGLADRALPGKSLTSLVDRGSLSKMLNFLVELRSHNAAFDWEMNVLLSGQIVIIHFAGAIVGGSILVVGARTCSEVLTLYGDLMQMNCEQINALRMAVKEKAELTHENSLNDSRLYNEISHLNNELAVLQRDLAKKNAELERLNEDLEHRVKERTSDLARANVELQEEIAERSLAEERLMNSLKEKEVLLREIHHRVKNNLQMVSSLLYLQSKGVSDSSTLDMFKESQNRIKSIALVHEMLLRSQSFTGIRFKDYIHNLVAYLSHSYNAAPSGIFIKLNVDDVILNIETAVPCGMIVNELVSNSLKYAFPGGGNGEVCVELHLEDDGSFRLIISDNGIGLDLEQQKMQTLGLRLVNVLVSQLDGAMRLDSCQGTRFEINFWELKYKERLIAKQE